MKLTFWVTFLLLTMSATAQNTVEFATKAAAVCEFCPGLQGRPLNQFGNFQMTENGERFKRRNPMKGRPAEPDRQAEIDFAKGVAGSLQNKADAIEKQFGTKHDKSTISKWLKGFDQEAV
jgi:hypothetical protein